MSDRDPLWGNRVRGLLMGSALGDAVGVAGQSFPTSGPARSGVTTQLAAFTVEGVIRAMMRMDHRGICHPPSVVWHAYCRWAALQGIDAPRLRERWAGTGNPWPDGWLARVPALAERRGSAPATVQALKHMEQGTTARPATSSMGAHSITRAFPIAAISQRAEMSSVVELASDVAALTHGDPAAYLTSAAGVALAAQCLTTDSLEEATSALQVSLAMDASLARVLARMADVVAQAADAPADPELLARLAPDATAPSALNGGLYVAVSFPTQSGIAAALAFALNAPDPKSVATVCGALLGAIHGVDSLPVDLLSRLELGWVVDTLARDLVAQITDSPGGSEYAAARDPYWGDRYPGW